VYAPKKRKTQELHHAEQSQDPTVAHLGHTKLQEAWAQLPREWQALGVLADKKRQPADDSKMGHSVRSFFLL